MKIREEGGQLAIRCNLDEVKELYRALFHALRSHGPEEFDDQDILLTLQLFLQRKAGEQGVDVSIHQDWERFLGYKHVEACEDRYTRYLPERGDGDIEKKG